MAESFQAYRSYPFAIAYRMLGGAMERLINRLKPFRRVATRSEQLAVTSLAIVTIAAIRIWL
jgi:transposase